MIKTELEHSGVVYIVYDNIAYDVGIDEISLKNIFATEKQAKKFADKHNLYYEEMRVKEAKRCGTCKNGVYKNCPYCNKDIILCEFYNEIVKPDNPICEAYENYKEARKSDND